MGNIVFQHGMIKILTVLDNYEGREKIKIQNRLFYLAIYFLTRFKYFRKNFN
jgi:hypothetical protein